MDFNNKFSANWYKNILSDQDINNKKQYIKNNLNTFIFPYSLKTGFINQTETGYKPINSSPSNYTQFTKALTGQEGLIAQWDGAIHITSLKVPKIINRKTITKTIDYKGQVKVKSLYSKFKEYVEEKKIKNHWNTFLEWLGIYCISQQTSLLKTDKHTYKFINTVPLDGNELTNYFVLADKQVNDKGVFLYKDTFEFAEDIKEDSNVEDILNKYEIDNSKSPRVGTSLDYFLTKWFDIDKASFFKGYLDIAEQEADFNDIPGASYFGDQQQWESVRRFSLLTTEEINKDFLFKLYIIPQHSNIGETFNSDDIELFYINNATTYYDNKGRQAYSLVQFASVNDSLATTGQTIQSKIMFGAPGEGYAIPKLIYDKKTGKPIDFEIDSKYTPDYGVSTIQIENFGVAGIMAPVIFGRPIENPGQVNERIYPSRQLFLSDLKYNVPDPLSKQTNPESIFYYGTFTPEILSSYSDWKEKRRAEYTDSIVKKFEGWLDVHSVGDITNSNPNGSSINDWSVIVNNVSKFDGRASTEIAVSKNKEIVNYDEATNFNIAGLTSTRPVDLLNHGAIAYKPLSTLPISSKQITPWSVGDIPLVGSFLSKITLGIPIGWRHVSKSGDISFPSFSYVNMFLSSPMYNWYTKSYWNVEKDEDAKGRIPFDPFKHSSNDAVGGLIDNASQSTVICGNITDKIKTHYWDFDTNAKSSEQIVISSIYLGSKLNYDKKQENKQPYWTVDTEALNSQEETKYLDYTPKNDTKYIIDAIGEFAIGKCPIKLTTFMNDPDLSNPYFNINWQTTLKSKSMYTDNIRDIQTVYKTSYIDDFIDSDIIATFPPQPEEPFPSFNIADKTINIDYENDNQIGSENGGQVYVFKHAKKHYWTISASKDKNGTITEWGVDNVKDDPEGSFSDLWFSFNTHYLKDSTVIFDFKTLGYSTFEELFNYYSKISFDLICDFGGGSQEFRNASDWQEGWYSLPDNGFPTGMEQTEIHIKIDIFSTTNKKNLSTNSVSFALGKPLSTYRSQTIYNDFKLYVNDKNELVVDTFLSGGMFVAVGGLISDIEDAVLSLQQLKDIRGKINLTGIKEKQRKKNKNIF